MGTCFEDSLEEQLKDSELKAEWNALAAEHVDIFALVDEVYLISAPKLTPSYHGEDCIANGEHEDIECCCDECSFYQECWPDWRELMKGE